MITIFARRLRARSLPGPKAPRPYVDRGGSASPAGGGPAVAAPAPAAGGPQGLPAGRWMGLHGWMDLALCLKWWVIVYVASLTLVALGPGCC